MGALRLAGTTNIATGLRRNARDAHRPLALLGLTGSNRTSSDYAEALWSAWAIAADARTCTALCFPAVPPRSEPAPPLTAGPRRLPQGQFDDVAAPSRERQRHRPGAGPNEPWTLRAYSPITSRWEL